MSEIKWTKSKVKTDKKQNEISKFKLSIKFNVTEKFYNEKKEFISEELMKEIEKDKYENKSILIDYHSTTKKWNEKIINVFIIIQSDSWLFTKYKTILDKLKKILSEWFSKKENEKIEKENEAIKILYQVSNWTYKWNENHLKIRKKYPDLYNKILDNIVAWKTEKSLYKETKFENEIISYEIEWFILKWNQLQNISLNSNYEIVDEKKKKLIF